MTSAIYIYYTPDWQPLADLVLPAIERYADKYRYMLCVYRQESLNIGLSKMKFIPWNYYGQKYDFIWILDLDTFITNSAIPFTDFVDNEHDIFICNDIHGINAGSWIVRNTPASRSFVQKVIEDFDAPEEQTVMKRYLDMVRVKYLPHPSINSYRYSLYVDEIGERIMTHEEGEWQPGDLLLHLPGVSLERRVEIFKSMI